MRLLFLSFTVLIFTFSFAQDEALIKDIAQMAEMDREHRLRAMRATMALEESDPLIAEQWQKVIHLDSIHGLVLETIRAQYGWDNLISADSETAHQIWILVMHQDDKLDMQESLLQTMKRKARYGNVIIRDLAYLEDRVAVNKGELQLYATQTYLHEKRKRYVPFEYVKRGLKKRRKKMSLKPLRRQLREERKQIL